MTDQIKGLARLTTAKHIHKVQVTHGRRDLGMTQEDL